MNWEAIGAVGEVVGAIGVILTLAYLAVQIRHNTRTAQASTELEASKQLTSYVERVSRDLHIQKISDTVAAGNDKDLSPEEHGQYCWLMAEFFHRAEGIFNQYEKGFISSESWAEWERVIAGLLNSNLAQSWWKNRTAPFSPEFFKFGDLVIERSPEWKPPDTTLVKEIFDKSPSGV